MFKYIFIQKIRGSLSSHAEHLIVRRSTGVFAPPLRKFNDFAEYELIYRSFSTTTTNEIYDSLLTFVVVSPNYQVGIPTEAGLPHAFGNAFRNVAALIADIDFTFKEAGVM